MPLPIVAAGITKIQSSDYILYSALVLLGLTIVRAYAQGRTTSRDRDLHGRTILLTGAFTPLGGRLLEDFARRGAHIIATTDRPIESEPVTLVVEALRETAKNEQIFAEYCDTHSTESTREFCTKFLTGKEHRLDAIVLVHEYEHVGPLFPSKPELLAAEERRAAASDCTFLMTTLLLPALLVAPAERDIRIINVVNPFYAAAIPRFPNQAVQGGSTFLLEGYRSLRSIVLMRHLQRVLDALPQAPAPDPDAPATVVSNKTQKSNIVSVSVSPGFSRQDTVSPLIRASPSHVTFSAWGLILYLVLQPLLHIFAKSPFYVSQTILHALFLPTPFKFALASDNDPSKPAARSAGSKPSVEALKPGALYSDCSVVQIDLSKNLRDLPKVDAPATPKKSEKGKETLKGSEEAIEDDGEYGGQELGQFVWESFEKSLKEREKREEDARAVATAQGGIDEKKMS